MSMQTEDLYDARKRIIQLEYEVALLKIYFKFWLRASVLVMTSSVSLVLILFYG
jgi:hypothetical protein